MATTEKIGLQKYKDDAGNITIMYPITKAEAVDGLEEMIVTPTLESLGAAAAEHDHEAGEVNFADGESLQEKYDNGDLGGDTVASLSTMEVEEDGTAKIVNQLAEAGEESGQLEGYATESFVQEQVGSITLASLGGAAANHNHDGVYAPASHNHEGVYAAAGHSHTPASIGAPTVAEMNAAIEAAIGSAIGGSY